MSLASKIGTIVGTGTAYAVHFLGKNATPLGVIGIVYNSRKEIQRFAIKHALDKSSPDAVQDNLLECLEYME